LSDAPPDAELLEAASRDELGDPERIAEHAERLLATPRARENLEAAMQSHFRLPSVTTVVIDPTAVPGVTVTSALLGAIRHEGELFFREHLWNGTLENLLTTRRTFANAELSNAIYGVAPPAAPDADGFGAVELAEERSGLLTLSAFLTSRARPDGASVVGRGLAVNAALICATNPLFEEGDPGELPPMQDWTERQKAEFRITETECRSCHELIDPSGLALDVFDVVGRYRSTDAQGRPIDPSTTLPAALDGREVSGPAELASVIAESDRYKACMLLSFMNFALSELSQGGATPARPTDPTSGCALRDPLRAFLDDGEHSFSRLVTEVARSDFLRIRRGEP